MNNVGDMSICKRNQVITQNGKVIVNYVQQVNVTLADHNGHLTFHSIN